MIRSVAMILLGFGGIVLLVWFLFAVLLVIFILRSKGVDERSICLLTDNTCIHRDDGVDCSQCHLCGCSPPKRRSIGDAEDDDRK